MSFDSFRALRELIGLGALLHDIGKLQTRLERHQKRETDSHKYLHEELGKKWIEKHLEAVKFDKEVASQLREVCKKYNLLENCENIDPLKVIFSAFYHHEPSKGGKYQFFSKIYQKADYASVTERDKERKKRAPSEGKKTSLYF